MLVGPDCANSIARDRVGIGTQRWRVLRAGKACKAVS